jgi:hypothetical protein
MKPFILTPRAEQDAGEISNPTSAFFASFAPSLRLCVKSLM